MNVSKFGGSSMADENTWDRILSIIKSGDHKVIVVSAIYKATNTLIEAIPLARDNRLDEARELSNTLKVRHKQIIDSFFKKHQLQDNKALISQCYDWIDKNFQLLDEYLTGISKLGEVNEKAIDYISSVGERLSAWLLAACGRAVGLNTVYVDSGSIIHTDNNFGAAVPDTAKIQQSSSELKNHLQKGNIPIMGGFFGKSPEGEITTFGRGGSDFSASLLASALNADTLQIWTDVDGMYTCDPRYVSEARLIPEISYNEAAELAYFGAKILHPATIQPAVEKNIPVYIRNTFSPEQPGTRISSKAELNNDIRAIAFKQGITIVTINSSRMLMAYGFLARVFSTFEKYKVPVDLVTTSEVSISMTVDSKNNLDLVLRDLEEFGEVHCENNKSLICLVGRNFNQTSGIAIKVFRALTEVPVRMITQGSSDINLSLVVDDQYVVPAVQSLHGAFFS